MKFNQKMLYIPDRDVEKISNFEDEHEECFYKYRDVSGAQFSYCFTPTGLGIAITVECPCGASLHCGDFLE